MKSLSGTLTVIGFILIGLAVLATLAAIGTGAHYYAYFGIGGTALTGWLAISVSSAIDDLHKYINRDGVLLEKK